MSDPVGPRRRLVGHLKDMISICHKVGEFVAGMEQSKFASDIRTYDATLFNIALLGEAATHVPEPFREEHSEVHWRDIIGVRNRIIHVYPGVDVNIVWSIIEDDLPRLALQLQALLSELEPDKEESVE